MLYPIESIFPSLSKPSIRQLLVQTLEQQFQAAVQAAQQAKEHATHSESIAEHRYDTLGLESSYLAEGQSKRALELSCDINALKELALLEFEQDSPISTSALVLLKKQSDMTEIDQSELFMIVFIAPIAGGLKTTTQHKDLQLEILVVTNHSPLGKQLTQSYAGDIVTITVKGLSSAYEVCRVI